MFRLAASSETWETLGAKKNHFSDEKLISIGLLLLLWLLI